MRFFGLTVFFLLALPAAGQVPVTDNGVLSFDTYGPDKTGATDVSGLLQRAIDASLARGCVLWVSAGTYQLAQPVHIRGALTLRGAGRATTSARGRTRFVTRSPTQTLLRFDAPGQLLLLEDLSLENLSAETPTAGCGLHVIDADGTVLNRVSVINFFDNVSVESGIYWKMHQCALFDPVRYGVWIRNVRVADVGDMSISDCEFVTNYFQQRSPQAAVQWQSGGGLRFQNNKINWAGGSRWRSGIRLVPDAGVQTSVFLIDGNSIENCADYGLYVGASTDNGPAGAVINALLITDNEFGITGTSVCLDLPQRAGGPDAQALQSVVIAGNQLYGGYVGPGRNDNVGWGIRASNVGHVDIGSNHYVVSSGAVRLERCHNVSYQPGNLKRNGVKTGLTLYENVTAGLGEYAQGNLTFTFTREIPATTSTTFLDLYDLWVWENRGYVVTVECTGTAPGSGPFAQQITRYVAQTAPDTRPTVRPVGTDYASSLPAELTWLPAPNRLTLRLRKRPGEPLRGVVRVSITGPLTRLVQH